MERLYPKHAQVEISTYTLCALDTGPKRSGSPGGRYRFVVRATRGNLHADSDSVAVTMPSHHPGTLQGAELDVDFSARANDATTDGTAGWSSDRGVLYWLAFCVIVRHVTAKGYRLPTRNRIVG